MTEPKVYSYSSMGTMWKITVWDEVEENKWQEICKNIFTESEKFDHTYSRFIKTSLVTELSTKTGVFEVPADFTKMLELYFSLYELSKKKVYPANW